MWKKGKHLSVAFETNLFSAATLSVRLCTSFMVFGNANSIMACILSRLTLIPLWDTMKPRYFPAMLQTHTCLDSVSCYKIRGCRRSLRGRSSGRPLIRFLPSCHLHKLAHSSQSNVQIFCSSAFDTWRPRS